MKKDLSTSAVPRLHAVDLYQRKGIYRDASIEKTFDWIEKILAAGLKHKVMYHARIESKERLKNESLQGTIEQRELAEEGKSQHPLYRLYFPHLLFDLQDYLEEVNSYGLLIVDQQKEHNHYGELEIYRAWRTKGFLTRVLEAPIYRDSRRHTLLALPDVAGFVTSGLLVDSLREKVRPRLAEWHDRYVNPSAIKLSRRQGINFRRILAVSNFYLVEDGGSADLSKHIEMIEAAMQELEENG